jgi:hypothetical protein
MVIILNITKLFRRKILNILVIKPVHAKSFTENRTPNSTCMNFQKISYQKIERELEFIAKTKWSRDTFKKFLEHR